MYTKELVIHFHIDQQHRKGHDHVIKHSTINQSENLTTSDALPTVYVANTGDDKISVISDKYYEIAVGKGPVAMAQLSNESGHFVYAVNESGLVSVIDTTNHNIIKTIQLPGKLTSEDNRNITATINGKYVYIANQGGEPTGSITMIDTLHHTVITSIQVEKYPITVAVTNQDSSTPNKLYAISTGRHSKTHALSIIDTATYKVTKKVDLHKARPRYLAITPDNNFFILGYHDKTDSGIYIGNVNTDNFVSHQKTKNHERMRSITPSADGKFIYVGYTSSKLSGVQLVIYATEYLYKPGATPTSTRMRLSFPNYHTKNGSPLNIIEVEEAANQWGILVSAVFSREQCIHYIKRIGDSFTFEQNVIIPNANGYFDVSSDHQYIVTANSYPAHKGKYDFNDKNLNKNLNTITYVNYSSLKAIKTIEVRNDPEILLVLDNENSINA